jgi:hypothetical protein
VADYDVGVTGLSVPPTSAPLTEYRPAVSVRNNGVHAALAFGSMRIYSAGLLIQTLELYSGTIQPGDTKDAQADRAWTPPGLGPYLIIADVTCDHDQYEPNNHLAPTYITVTAAPPPPPPPVALHAGQHEDGGADEVNIDGLIGLAAEPQTPADHKTTHQAGGADQLDVSGLSGTLATPQPIAPHHQFHEDGGPDKVNVDGLHGTLADSQTPKVHNNSQHDPNYAIDPHGPSSHTPGVEATANKGQANGYCDLDTTALVPVVRLAPPTIPGPTEEFLRRDRTWQSPTGLVPLEHHISHQVGGVDEVSIAGLSGKAADAQTPTKHASDHSVAGTDIIMVGGIHGLLADPQTPLGHKTSHQSGGTDELNVNGLHGILADQQTYTPVNHAPSHELGGVDPISVAGLSGVLATPQDPATHGADKHNNGGPVQIAIDGANLEGNSVLVSRSNHVHNGAGCIYSLTHDVFAAGGIGETSLVQDVITSLMTGQAHLFWRAYGYVKYGGLGTSTATILVRFGSVAWPSSPVVIQMNVTINHIAPFDNSPFELCGSIQPQSDNVNFMATMRLLRNQVGCTPIEVSVQAQPTYFAKPLGPHYFSLSSSQPVGVGAEIHLVSLTVERLRIA